LILKKKNDININMKIDSPLLSLKASGSFANIITFSKRKTHQHARSHQGKNRAISPLQAQERKMFDLCILKWRSLSSEEKEYYSKRATESKLRVNGYQFFCSLGNISPETYLDTMFYLPHFYIDENADSKDLSKRTTGMKTYGIAPGTYEILNTRSRKNPYMYIKKWQHFYSVMKSGQSIPLSENNATICFLCYRRKLITTARYLTNYDGADPLTGYSIYANSDTALRIVFHAASPTYTRFYTNDEIENKLLYVSMVFSTGNVKFYVNGKLTKNLPLTNWEMGQGNRLVFFSRRRHTAKYTNGSFKHTYAK